MKSSQAVPQMPFVVRQKFRVIEIAYFLQGGMQEIQHLPEYCDTILDLINVWPTIMEWIRANKDRSVSLTIRADKKEESFFYCEIDHAIGKRMFNISELQYTFATKNG